MKAKGLMTTAKPRTAGKLPDASGGFSLLELMIVIAIALAISATATPAMVNVVSSARMRGAMTNLATFLQQTRGNAVRNNVFEADYIDVASSEYFVYQQTASATQPAMSTAAELLPMGKQVVYVGNLSGSNVPAALDTGTAFGNSGLTALTGAIAWNTRGLPCSYGTGSGPAACTNAAFIWYFTFQPPWGSSRWAAMSVSPAGRIKSWYWDGAQWTN
jgi:prepilin-type N-terminal cleavage/methylation domain-containing protein